MDAAAAADALADVQRVAHQHAGLGLGGVDGDLLAVLVRIAPFQPQARLVLLLGRHQAVVLLEMLGPFGRGIGIVGLGHQRRRAHQRGHAEHAAGAEEVAARGFQGVRLGVGGCGLHRAVGWSILGRAGAGRLVDGHVFLHKITKRWASRQIRPGMVHCNQPKGFDRDQQNPLMLPSARGKSPARRPKVGADATAIRPRSRPSAPAARRRCR
jgi:hypothetical protein